MPLVARDSPASVQFPSCGQLCLWFQEDVDLASDTTKELQKQKHLTENKHICSREYSVPSQSRICICLLLVTKSIYYLCMWCKCRENLSLEAGSICDQVTILDQLHVDNGSNHSILNRYPLVSSDFIGCLLPYFSFCTTPCLP